MIEISKSPTADSRTCDYRTVTIDELYRSSELHINDVRRGLAFFRYLLEDAAALHDFDKLSDIEGFHRDFATGFAKQDWYDRHRKLNRHHLSHDDGVPGDVNLIDVLDMIADCVMAGMARSGVVYPIVLPVGLLARAFDNTVELLKRNVRVRE